METKQETARTEEAQAVFDRVWKRVMTGGRESCPIAWEPPEAPALPAAASPEDASPAVPAAPCPDCPRGDFPEGPFCLGQDCMETVPRLQELLRRLLGDLRCYQALARRTGGGPARSLNALAMEKKRQAKRLSAACFLISGVKYWPEVGGRMETDAYLGALRRRFMAEQSTMTDCLAIAESTGDPCLRQLLWELARGTWEIACRIRKMVEEG